jgi:adenine deaminase
MISIRTVIERLREIGGGAVFAIGETVMRNFLRRYAELFPLHP